jgi:UDP-N-acetylmuramoyl-tripeptide--D-alanyl-D-alanine ligase
VGRQATASSRPGSQRDNQSQSTSVNYLKRKRRPTFSRKRRFAFLCRYLYPFAWLVLRSRRPFIIGVTGSAGKTTTTLLIGDVLKHEDARAIVGTAACTVGSLNDSGGLPATVLGYDQWFSGRLEARLREYLRLPLKALKLATTGRYPDVLVLEYGAGGTSDIARLAKLAPPDIAIVTTIGPAHLKHFKTLDAIVLEKGKLVQAVPPSGLVVLGEDHDHVGRLEALARAPVVKLSGSGLELSAAIARTVARQLEVPDKVVDEVLENFEPPDRRQTLWRFDHLTVMDDSFNANPLSMKLGLETLGAMSVPGNRRLAILGAMGELGEEASRYHREIGELARRHADLLVGVGELSKFYGPDRFYPTSRACAEDIGNLVEAEDCILVKGSNAVRMEPIVRKLKTIGREATQAR